MNCDNCKDREAEFYVVMFEPFKKRIDLVMVMCEPCKEAFELGEARASDGADSEVSPIHE